ncbi:hypothetical protein IMCC1989_2531 [gamma proteobacterium IMCC1989]|nr:hypothetical protein IMCC1989_2531 [gamma proteobacterium IMCC1989]
MSKDKNKSDSGKSQGDKARNTPIDKQGNKNTPVGDRLESNTQTTRSTGPRSPHNEKK